MRNTCKVVLFIFLILSQIHNFASAQEAALSVLDSNNVYGGKYLNRYSVAIKIGDIWYASQYCFAMDGISNDGDSCSQRLVIEYTTANCTGTKYIYASGPLMPEMITIGQPPLTANGYYTSAIFYYPQFPFSLQIIRSESINGYCVNPATPLTYYVGVMNSVTMTFTPPFTVN